MKPNELSTGIIELFENMGASPETAANLKSTILIIGIIIISIIANYVTKKVLVALLTQIIKRSKNKYDDIFLEKKVFNNLSHIVPALIIYFTIPYAIDSQPWINAIQNAMYLYMIIVVLMVINSFLNALHEVYKKLPMSKDITIKGYIQVVKIIFYIIGIILITSVLINTPPGKLLATLGASVAILMLIFKDTILGFVASIQLSAYKMLKPGDWISMPSRGADGTVIDISLSTVKVQNFDKTITTIPTYALVSESFTNWKGMQMSGSRRIKRSITLDMKSVKFCDEKMLDKFSKIHVLKDYITEKQKELKEYNEKHDINDEIKVNGRRMTNLGTFRKYLENYLRNRPDINQDFTFLIRQLAPDEKGVPMEIYVFATTTDWVKYEGIQSDIFDHIFAVIPEFDLRVFQNPTGDDLQKVISTYEANKS